jgi:sugar phosphate isomerase/epimerase
MNLFRFPASQWTFSTLGCPKDDLATGIARAQRLGFKKLEIRALEGRIDLPALLRERFQTPEALSEIIHKSGIEVAMWDTSFKLVGSSAEDRDALLEFIPWAEALQVPWLRVFDGGTFVDPLPEENLQEATETLSWWNELRAAKGWKVDFLVETHDCLCSAANCLKLHESSKGQLKILWDTHHTWKKAGEPLETTWKAIHSMVYHLHVKDSISKPSARHPFTYVHSGDGEFPFDTLAKTIATTGFDHLISLEWERQWHPYLDELDLALDNMAKRGFFEG